MTISEWARFKTTELSSQIDDRSLAILPVGAVEQHGPHLPLATDSLILEYLVQALGRRTLSRGRAFLLPLLPVGLSVEHKGFAGTLTIGEETLLALWCDIARSVARTGIRRFVFLNSHGGNAALAQVAAMRLRDEVGLLAAVVTTHRFGAPPEMLSPDEARYGIHGGHAETALVRHLAPELVDETQVRDFVSSEPAIATPLLSYTGPVARMAWRAEDLSPAGAVGNAAAASPADGAALFEHLIEQTLAVLDALVAAPLPDLSR